ncbi:hypothetical protein Tco_0019420 [Tanacetum coccineum]
MEDDEYYGIDDLDTVIQSAAQELLENDHRNKNLEDSINRPDSKNCGSNSKTPIRHIHLINTLYAQEEQTQEGTRNEHLYSASAIEIDEKRSELIDLPSHLEYAYLKGDESCLESFKHVIQPQRRLNLKFQDMVKDEIIRLLDSGLIYPTSNSPWVSLIHVIPKKGGMTVVLNDNNELIPSRTCPYKTFTYPYRTFAYRRMPFGLCNALATFQRYTSAIFHDMVEDFMEVFMDDFSVFGNSFD